MRRLGGLPLGGTHKVDALAKARRRREDEGVFARRRGDAEKKFAPQAPMQTPSVAGMFQSATPKSNLLRDLRASARPILTSSLRLSEPQIFRIKHLI